MKNAMRVLLVAALLAAFTAVIGSTASAQTSPSYSLQESCSGDGFVIAGSATGDALGYSLSVISVTPLGATTTYYDFDSWSGSTAELAFVDSEQLYNVDVVIREDGGGLTLVDALDGTGPSGLNIDGLTAEDCEKPTSISVSSNSCESVTIVWTSNTNPGVGFQGMVDIGGTVELGYGTDPESVELTAFWNPGTYSWSGQIAYDQDGLGLFRDSGTVTVEECAGGGGDYEGDWLWLVDPSQGLWHLYSFGGDELDSFFFGNPGDYPIMGDWDCDGVATPGMYRQSDGYVYLRNSNSQGVADIRFFFGNPGDVPIVGDFNGDGCDTVGIYRPSNQTFYIINELGKDEGGLGAAEFSYVFGNPGDKPFVGDFDGDGIDTVGLHRESTGLVYFRNSHSAGNADNQFIFGDPGDRFVALDLDLDSGVSTPALFRPSNTTFYLKFTNSQGNADYSFVPMPVGADWLPVAGPR